MDYGYLLTYGSNRLCHFISILNNRLISLWFSIVILFVLKNMTCAWGHFVLQWSKLQVESSILFLKLLIMHLQFLYCYSSSFSLSKKTSFPYAQNRILKTPRLHDGFFFANCLLYWLKFFVKEITFSWQFFMYSSVSPPNFQNVKINCPL